jgi:hypothetical protein
VLIPNILRLSKWSRSVKYGEKDMGEGIYPAVKSGILAAEAIVNNTEYSLKNFKKYSMGLEIGKLIEHCSGINAAILKLKSAM